MLAARIRKEVSFNGSTCALGDEAADELTLLPAPPTMLWERWTPRTMLSQTAANGGRFGDVRLIEDACKSGM